MFSPEIYIVKKNMAKIVTLIFLDLFPKNANGRAEL